METDCQWGGISDAGHEPRVQRCRYIAMCKTSLIREAVSARRHHAMDLRHALRTTLFVHRTLPLTPITDYNTSIVYDDFRVLIDCFV